MTESDFGIKIYECHLESEVMQGEPDGRMYPLFYNQLITEISIDGDVICSAVVDESDYHDFDDENPYCLKTTAEQKFFMNRLKCARIYSGADDPRKWRGEYDA